MLIDERMAAAEATPAQTAAPEQSEYVLNTRQMASVLFVVVTMNVVFAAAAYMVGRASAPTVVQAAPPVKIESPKPAPLPQATITREAPQPVKADAPIFAQPENGALYIQMAAVEKGISAVFVEGLRRHGFEAFAAPGPNDKIFRVLIGPLRNDEAYARAKAEVDQMELSTFARRYEQ